MLYLRDSRRGKICGGTEASNLSEFQIKLVVPQLRCTEIFLHQIGDAFMHVHPKARGKCRVIHLINVDQSSALHLWLLQLGYSHALRVLVACESEKITMKSALMRLKI